MLLFMIGYCASSESMWKLQCLLIFTRRKFTALITEMSSAALRGVDFPLLQSTWEMGNAAGTGLSVSFSLQKKQ